MSLIAASAAIDRYRQGLASRRQTYNVLANLLEQKRQFGEELGLRTRVLEEVTKPRAEQEIASMRGAESRAQELFGSQANLREFNQRTYQSMLEAGLPKKQAERLADQATLASIKAQREEMTEREKIGLAMPTREAEMAALEADARASAARMAAREAAVKTEIMREPSYKQVVREEMIEAPRTTIEAARINLKRLELQRQRDEIDAQQYARRLATEMEAAYMALQRLKHDLQMAKTYEPDERERRLTALQGEIDRNTALTTQINTSLKYLDEDRAKGKADEATLDAYAKTVTNPFTGKKDFANWTALRTLFPVFAQMSNASLQYSAAGRLKPATISQTRTQVRDMAGVKYDSLGNLLSDKPNDPAEFYNQWLIAEQQGQLNRFDPQALITINSIYKPTQVYKEMPDGTKVAVDAIKLIGSDEVIALEDLPGNIGADWKAKFWGGQPAQQAQQSVDTITPALADALSSITTPEEYLAWRQQYMQLPPEQQQALANTVQAWAERNADIIRQALALEATPQPRAESTLMPPRITGSAYEAPGAREAARRYIPQRQAIPAPRQELRSPAGSAAAGWGEIR